MPRWLRWSILALVSWGVWAIMVKLIGEALTGTQNQALSTLGLFPIMLALGFSGKLSASVNNRRRGIFFALAGGAVSCLGNIFYYDVLSRGGKASVVVPLTSLAPLVTVLLAMIWLKERLNRIQFTGMLVSLAAIYLFNVQREEGLLSGWLLYALAPVLWGAAGFFQKLSTNHISGELSTLWFLAAFVPFGVLFLWQSPLTVQLSSATWLLVILQGFFLGLGNYAVLVAFADHGKASIVMPLTALYPVVSVPIAIFVLGERIGVREGIGILLALASVTMLSLETRPPIQAHSASNSQAGTML